jgi:hypothetical protein
MAAAWANPPDQKARISKHNDLGLPPPLSSAIGTRRASAHLPVLKGLAAKTGRAADVVDT